MKGKRGGFFGRPFMVEKMAETLLITLEEMKGYLRVDYDDDDELIVNIIRNAESLVMDAGRLSGTDFLENKRKIRLAVLYAAAYLYEHRESANHKELMLNLRALLFGVREAAF